MRHLNPCAVPFVLLALVNALSCTAPLRRFPLASPMRRDDDMRPIARVRSYRSSDAWDFVDQTVFQPLSDVTSLRESGESVDVNAVDEIPDSSWFTNRLGAREVPIDEIANGSCTTPPIDTTQRWQVVSAKPNGFNPGFVIRAPDGTRYVLKADGVRQTELATGADAVGARIYHALGYFAPCNRVVHFDRSILNIAPGAHAADDQGRVRPIDATVIDRVLRQATRLPDGRYRMSASRYIEGEPIGPFTYEGVRDDDANDVVPHEDRREIRAARLVAAWINHYDTREQNTFTTWITVPGGGYVRHYMLDFGDALGAAWPWDDLSARSGHAYVVDVGQIGVDFLTFGAVVRPWDRAWIDSESWVFTYFHDEDFDPEAWRGINPNPAFGRMTERDAAWMARLIARFDAPRVHAVVASAAFTHPEWSAHLERVLMGRRARILARYLSRRSPLTDVRIEHDRICATDLARREGLSFGRDLRVEVYAGSTLAHRVSAMGSRQGDEACTQSLPHASGLAALPDADARRYVVVDVIGAARTNAPLRVHLYDLDARGFVIAGIERPADASAPGH